MPNNLLETLNIRKEYPGVVALDDVSFALAEGEIHCIAGENGAGKSTLVKILAGSIMKNAGKILLGGVEVELTSPSRAREMGISVIYQDSDSNLIPEFTIAQNISLGREMANRIGIIKRRKISQRAQEVLEGLKIGLDVTKRVKTLSNAEKTLVQVAKAFSLNSRIFVIDEPTSSLGDLEKEDLIALLYSLRANNKGIIFISHHIQEILRVADRITVLRDGKCVGTRRGNSVSSKELIEMIVGRSIANESLVQRGDPQTVLEVRDMSSNKGIRNIGFRLHKGEILGFAGIVGSGRTEVARAIYGVDRITAGEVLLNGRKVEIRSPLEAIRNGIAMVPEDRFNEGILPEMSVMENLTLASLDKVARFGFKNKKKQMRISNAYVHSLSIKTPGLKQFVKYLSGGNQQKVVLGKCLNTGVKIIILDEPTKGVDVAGKSDIHNIIASLARKGISFVLISSELPELIKMCNRILVMRKGCIVNEFTSEDVTQVDIMSIMGGLEK